MTKIIAKPATPPTIPPTRSCVGGAPLPPEPTFEFDEGVGVGAVLPELLFPPAPAALVLDVMDANDAWLASCDEDGVNKDVANVAGVEDTCAELVTEARLWMDALGLVELEKIPVVEEMLANEDCEAEGRAKIEEDRVFDCVFTVLECDDDDDDVVVVEARQRINLKTRCDRLERSLPDVVPL